MKLVKRLIDSGLLHSSVRVALSRIDEDLFSCVVDSYFGHIMVKN